MDLGVDARLDRLLTVGDITSRLHSTISSIEFFSFGDSADKPGEGVCFGTENEVIGAENGMFIEELVTNPFMNGGPNIPAGGGRGPPKWGGIRALWNEGIKAASLFHWPLYAPEGYQSALQYAFEYVAEEPN